ncbi:MAG: protein phosphatase 2C domain-containing protein [Nibricoccus sp.]
MQPPASSSELPPAVAQLAWSGMTHRGRVRANNEDAFLALTFDGHHVTYLGKIGEAPLASMDFVFAVSDGMGGANSGEFASRIAVDKITRLLPRSFRMGARGIGSDFADILPEVFTAIHKEMVQFGQSYEECAGMGATLSLCWFSPEWMYFGHIGDSRIYYLPKVGAFAQLTHDHTHVGWLRRKGRINEREARSHPQRNSLNQALGAGNQIIDPHIGAVGIQPGDRFLICSDGLTDGLWDKRIEEMLRSDVPVHDLARTLVEQSVSDSGKDNTTAVIIDVTAAPAQPAP